MTRYRVFSRLSSSVHPFELVLERWLSRTPPAPHSAMACNLICDHRVTQEREEQLLSYFDLGKGKSPEEHLENALTEYLDREIRHRKRPAFLREDLNRPNVPPDVAKHFGPPPAGGARSPGGPSPFHPDVRLARVIDMNGLVSVYNAAKWRREELFRDFPYKPPLRKGLDRSSRDTAYSREVLRWLDGHLLGKTLSQQKVFVAAVLDAIEAKRENQPYQPSWVTFWRSFEPYVAGGPERWASVLGMPNSRKCDRWLIVLKYPLRAAKKIVRPTILDAGWAPYHFPSPPQAALGDGGHPVDLRLSPPPDSLIPEFIHDQIPHVFEHWRAARFLLGRTHRPRCGWLARRRSNHHSLLAREYGDEIQNWMERCT